MAGHERLLACHDAPLVRWSTKRARRLGYAIKRMPMQLTIRTTPVKISTPVCLASTFEPSMSCLNFSTRYSFVRTLIGLDVALLTVSTPLIFYFLEVARLVNRMQEEPRFIWA